MAGWVVGGYPGGSVQVTSGDNFPWKQQPCKLVLHTTETVGYPSWGFNKSSHVTVHPHARTWRQHRALDKPAWTLRAPAGSVSTNSMGAIQIEIVGYAESIKDLSGGDLDYLMGFIRFILDQTGIPIQCSVLFAGGSAYGLNGSVRMSPAAWTAYRGILGHQHVPANDHWDPGDIPMQASWLPRIKGTSPAPPTPTPPPEVYEDMALISAPNRGISLVGPGYYLSLSPAQAGAWSKALREGPAAISDVEFDEIRASCSQNAETVPIDVDVDEDAIAAKVAEALQASGVPADLTPAAVQAVVDGVKALKQQYI